MRSRSNWKKLKSGNGNQKGISRICDRILWEKLENEKNNTIYKTIFWNRRKAIDT